MRPSIIDTIIWYWKLNSGYYWYRYQNKQPVNINMWVAPLNYRCYSMILKVKFWILLISISKQTAREYEYVSFAPQLSILWHDIEIKILDIIAINILTNSSWTWICELHILPKNTIMIMSVSPFIVECAFIFVYQQVAKIIPTSMYAEHLFLYLYFCLHTCQWQP